MKNLIASLLIATTACSALAAGTICVSQDGSHTPPYDTWATAANDIQTALDYSSANIASYDKVLVTNGTYAVAGKINIASATHLSSAGGMGSVTITRAGGGTTLLEFMAGSDAAVVEGFVFYDSAAQAVTMARGTLRNCVVTLANNNGIALSGGLVDGCVISNSSSRLNFGVNMTGGRINNTLFENIRSGNADNGGAALVMNNAGALVENCVFRANTASLGTGKNSWGGAVRLANGTLRNCLVVDNIMKVDSPSGGSTARGGGVGIAGGTMENCTIAGNTAAAGGGGVYQTGGTVRNCVVFGNASLANPDLEKSGGTFTYSLASVLPSGGGDTDNTDLNPLFMDASTGNYRLGFGSPAIDTGMEIPAVTHDLDGVARPVDGDLVPGARTDMGCYEAPDINSIPLSCSFALSATRGIGPLAVAFTASVTVDPADLHNVGFDWEIKDGNGTVVLATNEASFVCSLDAGVYDVLLEVAYGGETASKFMAQAIEVGAPFAYVSHNGSATFPYDTPAKATPSLQDAHDAAFVDGGSGSTILVADGEYALAGTLAIIKPVTFLSENGADNAIITRASGASAFDLVSISVAGAVVDGFSITNAPDGRANARISAGTVRNSKLMYGYQGAVMTGGLIENCDISLNSGRFNCGVEINGAATVRGSRVTNNRGNASDGSGDGTGVRMSHASALLENCVVAGNSVPAQDSEAVDPPQNLTPVDGIGVRLDNGVMRNCLVYGNTGEVVNRGTIRGGGVHMSGGTMENCTLADNWGTSGGGLYQTGGTVRNTIVFGNKAVDNPDLFKSGGTFTHSCASALPSGGEDLDNTALDPLFADAADGDYRLAFGSSAIDTGMTLSSVTNDLDGVARPIGLACDMGCYEAPDDLAGEFSARLTRTPLRGWGPLPVDFTSVIAIDETDLPSVAYEWEITDSHGAVVETSTLAAFTATLPPGVYDARLVATFGGVSATNFVAAAVEAGARKIFVSHEGGGVFPFDAPWKATNSLNAAYGAVFVEGGEGSEIRVADGGYTLAETLRITKPTAVVSESGADSTVLSRVGGNSALVRISNAAAVLDGFSITNNRSAMVVNLTLGTLRNSKIMNGTQGMVVIGGLVEDCEISGNVSRFTAGVSIYRDAFATVRRCRIFGNSGTGEGGSTGMGLRIQGSANTLVENCLITGNFLPQPNSGGTHYGVGVMMDSGVLRNSVIADNGPVSYGTVGVEGAGLRITNGGTVENCAITGNRGTLGSGVVQAAGTIRNTIVWGNTNIDGADDLSKTGGAFAYSCVPAQFLPDGGADINNIADDPRMKGAFFKPAENFQGRDAGLNAPWMETALDIAGNPRIHNQTVDIGACELSAPLSTLFLVK